MTKRMLCMMVAIGILLNVTTPLMAKNLSPKMMLILWRGETDAERGLKDGLKALGYTPDYTIVDAKQDAKELGRILRRELQPNLEQFDYIYTFGTTVSKRAKIIIQSKVPHIFGIPTYPVRSGIVESMERPGGNLSGTSSQMPVELIINSALKVLPFKRLGYLFNPRESNSMVERKQLQQLAAARKFELVDLRAVPGQNTLDKRFQELADKTVVVDAIYLAPDSYIVSQSKRIGARLTAAKIKTIGTIERFVHDGALMAVSPDYYALGEAAAEIVDRHQNGEALGSIPVAIAKELLLFLNKSTSQALGVEFSADVLKKAVMIE